jgi:amino acid adenylation domain-containing protein/non-ribosomal peptide synthase protein (TIGR01720 family)
MTKNRTSAIADVLPLSPLQEGLMFHALLADTGLDVYTVSTGLELHGEFDPAAARAAGQALLDRHANLRAGFRRSAKGAAVAVIAARVSLPWTELDLSGLCGAEQDRAVAAHLSAERERRFDLAKPPLLRISLIRTGPASQRLVFTHHHILLDGWSTPLLVREFFELYQAGGSATALPPVRPYRDYLAWLASWDAEAAKTAWRHALGDLSPAGPVEPTLVAPADPLRRPVVPEHVTTILPAELGDRLNARARERGLTVNTLVQVAWGLLLRAVTGRDDVVFGITVSGRPAELPGVESMIGLFINTVPVRIRVDPAEPIGALLDRIQNEQSALMDHQYLSLSQIQRAAGAGELFDTLAVFENYPFDEDGRQEPAPGLRLAAMNDEDATHYPLALVAQPGPRPELEIRYHPDLFSSEAAAALLDRLARILTGLVGDPLRPVGGLDVLATEERQRILTDWNADDVGALAAVEAATVPDFFDRALAEGPDRVALVFEQTELSYAELDARANRLAHRLIAEGAGPDRVVAVALPRSADLMVALLAVLKAGAAYLAIDLDYPPDRIGFMLADSAPAVLVATADSRRLLIEAAAGSEPGVDVRAVVLLGAAETERDLSERPVTRPTPAELGRSLAVLDAAYVIYTSGSTGRPKGVIVTHEGAAKLIATAAGRLGVGPDSRVLQFASPSFDVAFFELCMGLLMGARLVVTPAERRASDQLLCDYLLEHQVTHAVLPPALLTGMPDDVALPAGLTTLAGTEVVPPALVERFGGDRPLFNAYGPTEATVNSTLWRAEPGRPGPVPIGRPDPQALGYVLDSALNPVPAGVPGELYLAGTGLARGYLGRAALTAERFVASPFEAGARMYRTGDLVRWTADGILEFLGRADHQIKIRGFRIEPGEIEAVIGALPGVRRAVVIAREDKPGRRRLVGYLVADGSRPVAGLAAGVREQAAARLPEYMVPAAFVVLDRIPVTANGKLDTEALPVPDLAAGADGRAPRTPRETLLAELFARLLDVPEVGADDDFFALGGDSIVAMQLVSRARRAGLQITPRQVFQRRSVAGLAAVAGVLGDADGRIPAEVALIAIEPAESAELEAAHPGLTEVLPLSPLQEGLLFHASFSEAAGDIYTVQTVVELAGTVDAGRLRAAGQALLERHPNLRAGFQHLRSGQPVAVIAGSVTLPWTEYDLSALAAAARAAELGRRLDAEQAQPFDAGRPPLLRMALIRTGPQSHHLVLTNHHLLLDGWSRSPLLADLSALYAGSADPAALPPVVPYRNYLAWLAGQDLDRARAGWREALAGLEQPTLLARAGSTLSAPEQLRPAGHDVELSEELTAALAALARGRGLTLNTLVQAAWGVLLGRLTGRSDVVFGATVAGRPAELDGVESMIGLFINTVPVRVRCAPADSVETVLARLQEQQAALIEYQYLGLAQIQREAVQLQRAAGSGELFDTLVVFENYPDDAFDADPAAGDRLRMVAGEGRDATHYPLTWLVDPGPRLALEAEYRPDLFAADQVARIGSAMVQIFEAMVADPRQPIGRIDLLDPAGLTRVLRDWNATARDVPDTTLPDLFRAQVARTPGALAVKFEDLELTYAELDARVDQVAQALRGRGIGAGDTVAVALARSLELVIALHAVHRAGAAYLPIDPGQPSGRIDYLLEDASPAAVVTSVSWRDRFGAGVEVLVIEAVVIENSTDVAAFAPVSPLAPAYVIYTSGSTGRPKGVVVSQAAIVNRLLWMQDEYRLGSDDRVLQKTPAGFDVSVWEFFWPLISGAALVVARPEGHQDPAYLAGLIQAEQITTVHFVPSMLQAFLAEPAAAGCTGLRRVICSGEALPAELAARFAAVLDVRLDNLYGPTEAAVDVTFWHCDPAASVGDSSVGGSVPIGRPVWNTQVYVLDAGLRPVPVGVTGELYLAGSQLAQGYSGRSGLSAERFVANPFSHRAPAVGPESGRSVPGSRMYRTGDLVRWSADGVLEFLGRSDHQVKLRGFRIELGEIETAISSVLSGWTAIVQVREDRPGQRYLVACLVAGPAGAGGVDLDGLRSRLSATLPEYMVPSAFVVLDALPVTGNGKLDRAALPAPDFAAATGDRLPAGEREEVLAARFAEVLGLARVGADDDFFALGGDSIVAMRLVSLARRDGLRLTPRQVFKHRSVAALAEVAVALDPAGEQVVDRSRSLLQLTPDETEELAVVVPGYREVLPLSPLQTGLLFLAAFDSAEEADLDVYTVQMTFEVDGEVDAARLRAAGQALLERHPNLRAQYRCLRSGRAVAVVADGVQLPWFEADLSGLTEREQEAAWQLGLIEEGRRFDVGTAPLLRLRLVRFGSVDTPRYRLVLTHQHLLLDGWSRGPLMAELSRLYAEGSAVGTEHPDYRDHLAWLARQDNAAAGAAWEQALAGLSEPTRLVPVDPQRAPAVPQLRSEELSVALTGRLAALGRARGLTMNTLVQTAWAIVLGRLTGRDDVVFGATVSGRPADLDGAESMIGLFINTLPVRVRLDPGESVGALLDRLQTEQSELLAHQHLGLSDIQRRAGLGELFDTLMVFENYPDVTGETDAGPGDSGAPVLRVVDAGGRDATHYPFTWVVDPGSRLQIGAEYRADLFTAADVEEIIAAMVTVFETMADDAGRLLGQVDVLAPAARRRILHTWNVTDELDEVDDVTLADLFARQANLTPDATAVVGSDGALTFAELDERSNRLARLLIAAGAGPERLVALALPRTGQGIVAILAVLKSGAGYLPIDPEYPAGHIGRMLEDAAPQLLLSGPEIVLPASGLRRMLLDDLEGLAAVAEVSGAALTDADRRAPLHPDHPAYVIYTSGSTGRPKGVAVTHGSVVRLFRSHRELLYRPTIAATGRRRLNVGHAWSFSFDASWQPQLWMFDGHTVHVIEDDVRRDPDRLIAAIVDAELDFLELTPSHFGQLAEAGLITENRCPLAMIGVGGEAVPDALWSRLAGLTDTLAVNLYGPTESTVDALVARLGDSERAQVGRPVIGTRAYVLDGALRPARPGVTGELYLAGGGLARGYLGRAGLSAERFVADPFAIEAGAPAGGQRMYRTGDLATWTEDGRLVLAGRVDDQVKVRGYRIELAEVEAALDRQDAVGQALVVVREDRPGIKQLIGYVVAAPGFVPEPSDLRRGVAAVLPDHMVPTAFVLLDRLPVLANGKLDKAALPAPDRNATAGGRPPTTARQKVLCDVVAAVLGLPEVGLDDDFFALGGDSIVAMQLVSRLRGAGLKVTPRNVFSHRTPERLAAVAVEAGTRTRPDDGIGSMPITPVMHWLSEVDGPVEGFNQSAVLQVPADLAAGPLAAALQAVVDRHVMLRARLLRSPGWSLEVPAGRLDVVQLIRAVDIAGFDSDRLWSAVAGESAAAQARLDPEAGILLQVVHFDAGPSDPGRLLLVIHHLVVDGVSWRILIPDLAAAYAEAVRRGPSSEPIDVAGVDTSFRRWSRQLTERALDPAREAELPRWRSMFERAGRLPVLRELDPATDIAATIQELDLTLPTEQTLPLLTRVPAAFGGTVNDVLLTALTLAVSDLRTRYPNPEDESDGPRSGVLVALEGHGREEELVGGADLSRTVGWFTNVVPVHLDPGEIDLADALAGGPAAGSAVERVRAGLRSLPDNGMGFGLLRYLNPRTSAELAGFPEPQIEFNYMGRIDFPEATDWSYAPEAEAADNGADAQMPETYSLIINAQTEDRPGGPQLSVSWAWPDGVLSHAQVRDLGETWFRALGALTRHYDNPRHQKNHQKPKESTR